MRPATIKSSNNRRQFDRFLVPPMYTQIAVKPAEADHYIWDGHAYDISEGGIQFEIDHVLQPGTQVGIKIELPGRGLTSRQLLGAERLPVYALGNVVWVDDDDGLGPCRIAAVFSKFTKPGDRDRLLSRLASGYFTRAA